jgi:hypothetical protein
VDHELDGVDEPDEDLEPEGAEPEPAEDECDDEWLEPDGVSVQRALG